MAIKQNCEKCYYGGSFRPSEHLASCAAPFPKEATVTRFDELFKKERQFVRRKNWDDECDCGNFVPSLSEADGDYELEMLCTFMTDFDCPFCGETIYVDNLGIEETKLITCSECARQIAVHGKQI